MKTKISALIFRVLNFIRKPIVVRISLLLLGFTSTVWFLIRVIPKPSRATYPCMRAAAPLMSGFVIWILALSGTSLAFKKARQKLLEARYAAAFLLIIAGIGGATVLMSKSSSEVYAAPTKLDIWYKPNLPLGEAKGIFPGRVAWGYNPKIA